MCQSYTRLPSVIVDSMIFEVRKGRICDTLVNKQENQIQKMGLELMYQGKAIVLLKKESSTLDALLKNCEQLGTLAQKEFTIQKERLIVKIKKLVRVVIIEGGVIVVMIILLI
jgi:hypothetical protein